MKVGDDVGTDLFCTLFEIIGGQLLPRTAFGIQLKSSESRINATGKIGYFEKLELPFFIGVVDQSNLRLSIYSGEYIPVFFSHFGRPRRLTLVLESEKDITFEKYCKQKTKGEYVLRMPHILDLSAHEGPNTAITKATQLSQLCSRMLQNISAKVVCEYVFRLGDGRVVTFAGPGSAATFRLNFYYRLAEVFANLDWLYRNHRQQFKISEWEMYERCYLELQNTDRLPLELSAAYQALKQRMAN